MAKQPEYYSVHWHGPELNEHGRKKFQLKEFKTVRAARQYAKQLNAAFPERKAKVHGVVYVNIAGMQFAEHRKLEDEKC